MAMVANPVNSVMGGMPHYWPGTQIARRTAIILACPGRHEVAKARPAAAGTGANVDRLLADLGEHLPEAFPSADRYDYVIANSSCCVHYDALTDDSMPPDAEIRAPANISRLKDEIGDCLTALALGPHATLAADLIVDQGFQGRVLRCSRHLSFRGINSISTDVNGDRIFPGDPDATARRIAVIAEKIFRAM